MKKRENGVAIRNRCVCAFPWPPFYSPQSDTDQRMQRCFLLYLTSLPILLSTHTITITPTCVASDREGKKESHKKMFNFSIGELRLCGRFTFSLLTY